MDRPQPLSKTPRSMEEALDNDVIRISLVFGDDTSFSVILRSDEGSQTIEPHPDDDIAAACLEALGLSEHTQLRMSFGGVEFWDGTFRDNGIESTGTVVVQFSRGIDVWEVAEELVNLPANAACDKAGVFDGIVRDAHGNLESWNLMVSPLLCSVSGCLLHAYYIVARTSVLSSCQTLLDS